jgi:Exportin-5 family
MPIHCDPVPTLPSFLELMLRFSSTPSLWISIQTLTIWRNLLVTPTADRLRLPFAQLGQLLILCIDRLADFEDLLDAPEWFSYALFLREDFDEMETSNQGLFKTFLAGVKRILVEIVEGIVARECRAAIEYIGIRLRQFIEVDRLDERDRDGISFTNE